MNHAQVVKKTVPIDVVADSEALSALYVDDKLDRQAAYMQGVALAGQIELLTGQPLDAWQLQAGILVRRLEEAEDRERNDETGEYVLYNRSTGGMHTTSPLKALRFKFHIMTHTDWTPSICSQCTLAGSMDITTSSRMP